MSTYIYLTAETKIGEEWTLFKPQQENADWDGKLTPPLIIDGGWPSLARKMTHNPKNFGTPSDVSAAFNDFHMNVLKNEWSIGWGMYADLKNTEFEFGLNDMMKLSGLFKDIHVNKKDLRLIYWWG